MPRPWVDVTIGMNPGSNVTDTPPTNPAILEDSSFDNCRAYTQETASIPILHPREDPSISMMRILIQGSNVTDPHPTSLLRPYGSPQELWGSALDSETGTFRMPSLGHLSNFENSSEAQIHSTL